MMKWVWTLVIIDLAIGLCIFMLGFWLQAAGRLSWPSFMAAGILFGAGGTITGQIAAARWEPY